jgi:hypothetical protein
LRLNDYLRLTMYNSNFDLVASCNKIIFNKNNYPGIAEVEDARERLAGLNLLLTGYVSLL